MTSRAVGDLSVLTELPRLTWVSSDNVPDPQPSEGAETPVMADGFDWVQWLKVKKAECMRLPPGMHHLHGLFESFEMLRFDDHRYLTLNPTIP